MVMFWRALIVALWCASAGALTPLSAASDDNDCALYLAGPGRTSAYDYRLNLLRGNFGYDGQHTCITYDAVNQAYLDARKRILVSQPKGDWNAEDFASVGELVLDISINLARTYGLTYEEIEKGLPLIDTSRTLIREVCPPVFSHVECRAGKYRRLDGLCNNLRQPTWGATMAPFQRLIGPLFSDGINAPRIAHSGHDLPLSRVVSRTMHPDDGFHDHAGTVMVIAWGQFMDHDYTLTGTPLDPRNRNDPEECCKRPPHLKHPYCNEIRIPDDDYFYRLFGVKCIDFVRGFPSPRPGCRLGSRVPFNTLTGAIDGNTVYGVTEKFARKLRTGYGGLLRMNPVFEEYGLKDLLPLKLDIPDEGCTRPNKNMYCFEAGEIRVNEQLVLTVMHTLMAREHNRVAKGLAAVNPHWDDETLYQEARRINIAEIQHITYNEFLPVLLGKDVMEKFGLVLEKQGYWDGYDQNVNPDVIDAFAAAAYRFGHSLLPTAVERWSKAHKFIASKRLSDLIRRPYDLYRAGVLDEYVMGLMNQVAQAMDDSITQEVTNHLFKKIGARFGMDLVSFNMQRGREFGLPGYMEFRKFCGLSGADTFQDLFGSMPNETVRKYESIFEHPIDVDLWSGGVSERPLPGSMLGPTFACIIATQFSYSRRGDRFWFELPNQPSSFTPEQLKEVRKARLARVICDNTDIIDTTQLYPFVLPDHELNPRVPCRSGIIPSIDFSKWAEPPPFAGNAKQFVTDAIVQENKEDVCQEINDSELSTVNNQTNGTTDNGLTVPSVNSISAVVDSNLTQNHDDVINTEIPISVDPTIASTERKVQISPDTVMKYVFKDSEKPDRVAKSKGHSKNSLRKKRSTEEASETRAPLIVNYETAHTPGAVVTPYLQYPLKKKSQNIIQSNLDVVSQPFIQYPLKKNSENFVQASDLADFSLQTLHDRPIVVLDPVEVRNLGDDDKKQYEKKERQQKSPLQEISSSSENDSSESSSEVRESNEKHNPRKFYKNERLRKSYDKSDSEKTDNDEKSYRRKPARHGDENNKPNYRKKSNDDSSESNEGGEKEDYKSNEKSSSDESSAKESYEEDDNPSDRKKTEDLVKANLEDDSSNSDEEESSQSSKFKPQKSNEDSGESEEKYNGRHKKPIYESRENYEKQEYKDESRKPQDSRDSDETTNYNKTGKKAHYDSRESDEKQDYRNRDESRKPKYDSRESDRKPDYREIDKKTHYDSRESDEKQEYRNKDEIRKPQYDSRESDEKPDYRETGKKTHHDSRESDEKQEYRNTDEIEKPHDSRDSAEKPDHREIDEISKEHDDVEESNEKPYHRNKGQVTEDREDKEYRGKEIAYKNKSNLYKNRDDRGIIDDNHDYRKADEKEFYKNESELKEKQKYREESDETPDYNTKEVRREDQDNIQHYDEKPEYREKIVPEDTTEVKKENPQVFTQPDNPLIAFSRDITESEKNNYRIAPHVNLDGKRYNNKSAFKPQPFSKLLNSLKEEVDAKRPIKIQDVDLRDFSYERVKLNEQGVVEPISENYENASPSTLKPDAYRKNSDYTRKTNEGEIKPVVEISNESNESSEEKEHDRPPILYPIDDDKTVESFEKSRSDEIEKKAGRIEHQVSELKENPENVKQDFERIPLNYNHEKSNNQDDPKVQEPAPVAETPADPNDADQEDEVEYAPPPKEIKYDDKLNIKFQDTPIKLPEIRLPEDILAFDYKEPVKKNQKFYHRDSEENEDESDVKRDEDDGDDDDDTHYGPYKSYYKDRTKDNYEKNPDDDQDDAENDAENEDLYEKFVRERFGKQDSFKQRSEKLQQRNYVPNPKLYETIDKILKKTEETEKQAVKSGDPNAGYMWTLEYGENL